MKTNILGKLVLADFRKIKEDKEAPLRIKDLYPGAYNFGIVTKVFQKRHGTYISIRWLTGEYIADYNLQSFVAEKHISIL